MDLLFDEIIHESNENDRNLDLLTENYVELIENMEDVELLRSTYFTEASASAENEKKEKNKTSIKK